MSTFRRPTLPRNCGGRSTFNTPGAVDAQAVREGYDTVVTSSGGNAGLAVAHSARQLGIRARVFVTERTAKSVVATLRRENAEVVIHGDAWDDADRVAREFVATQGERCTSVLGRSGCLR